MVDRTNCIWRDGEDYDSEDYISLSTLALNVPLVYADLQPLVDGLNPYYAHHAVFIFDYDQTTACHMRMSDCYRWLYTKACGIFSPKVEIASQPWDSKRHRMLFYVCAQKYEIDAFVTWMYAKLSRFRDPDDTSDPLYLTDVYFQPWYARSATELKGVLAIEHGWTPNSDICEAIRQTTETVEQSVDPNVQTTPDSDIFGLTIQHVVL